MIVSPWYPVPPHGYGGTEHVAYDLARELHRRGHEVTVFGQQGSRGPFEVVAVAPSDWTSDLGTGNQEARENLFLYRVHELMRRHTFDVVHDHSGITGILLTALQGHPAAVATLHGQLSGPDCDFLAEVDHLVRLVAISHHQQGQCGQVDWSGMVYNAINPFDYQPVLRHEDKGDYVVQLARISPTKGQHLSIEVARRVGARLVLAGKVDADSVEYFEREIRPHLGRAVEWRENVFGDEKAQLLAAARAMIFPIQWEEPFGLAMVEAMVSGTPVLATPRGAVTEIVEPGITGWIADDVDGLIEAYGRLGEIDLHRCAVRAGERFGPTQMGDGYLALYEAARLGESFRKPA
ncbi:MAG TPA: glycosyltransferase family 4 protein [Candidatus Nitrosopolaris sp.]|nr:glycosyltransferase family 4 protein [Candidatus Nitrosopolaris sp.]